MMRGPSIVLASLLLFPAGTEGKDRVLDWVRVTDRAGWRPRDSSGEVVFKDRLWLLGGWFDSYSAPPRDVWSSADARAWDLVTREAPWKHSDLPMTVVFHDRIWLMWGWYNGRLPGHGASGEVWSSSDGLKWERATGPSGPPARCRAAGPRARPGREAPQYSHPHESIPYRAPDPRADEGRGLPPARPVGHRGGPGPLEARPSLGIALASQACPAATRRRFIAPPEPWLSISSSDWASTASARRSRPGSPWPPGGRSTERRADGRERARTAAPSSSPSCTYAKGTRPPRRASRSAGS